MLRHNGLLVAYDNYFTGQMIENDGFNRWYREQYLKKYPIPPRAKIELTEKNINPHGFKLLKNEWDKNAVNFSLERIVDYLVTQSNIIAAVEGGKEGIEKVRLWLTEGIKPMFADSQEKAFLFNAPVWCLTSFKGK